MPENRVWLNGKSQEEYITAFAQELAASLFYYDDQFDKYLHDPAWTDFTLATREIKKAKALLVKARALGLLEPKKMTKQILLSQITAKDIARFWSHVDKSGECWDWTAGRISSGYGMFNCESGRVYTHRFAWIITNGDIPNGLFVCHKCDNPPCVNPAHLFLGTVRDNARDSSAKGRNVFQKHPDLIRRGERHWSKIHPELIRRGDDSWSRNHLDRLARGEKGGCAKLTEQQVREIRQKRAHKQTLMSLASEYGVTLNAIYCIVKYITWRHVV